MPKYPAILQHNEEDCGAACLATIARYHGKIISISRARAAAGTGSLGTTLLNLRQGAKQLGFDARGVKATPQIVQAGSLPLPGIIHWQGFHWVVLYGYEGHRYLIADPGIGLRTLKEQEFINGWTNGVMLLLSPQATFAELPDDRQQPTGWQVLWGKVRFYRGQLANILLLNGIIAVLTLATPLVLQLVTDRLTIEGDYRLLAVMVVAAGIANTVASLLRFLQLTLVTHFTKRLQLDFILEFGYSLLHLPLAYFESHRSGEVTSRLRDIEQIDRVIAQAIVVLPHQLVVAIISWLAIGFYHPLMAGISLGASGGILLYGAIIYPRLKDKIDQLIIFAAENTATLIETFKGAIWVKAKNATDQFWEEFQVRYGKQAVLGFRVNQTLIGTTVVATWLTSIGELLLIWVGAQFVLQGDGSLSVGQLLAISLLNRNGLAWANSLLGFIDSLTYTQNALERFVEVIETLPESNGGAAQVALSPQATITLEQLGFHHPGRNELLTDFSLTIAGGQTTALVGRSGCGKSTLVKLLAGLYWPQSGQIRVGPYNLADLSLECRRSQIVIVPQEPHSWTRSILENLKIGNADLSWEQIIQACEIANVDSFVGRLPQSYQTVLGEFGANLSGGQRQRLAIALGIVTDPPILILDESTSNLDPLSEAEVLKKLLCARQQKTTIIISHRPRAVQLADHLIVMEAGQPIVQGTVARLQHQPGLHQPFLGGDIDC